jgi:hypothetical protein
MHTLSAVDITRFFFQSKQMLSRETSKPLPKQPRTYVLHAVDCTLYMPKIDIKKSMPKIDKKKQDY